MADRYWVGNGGNWSSTSHWSASSGGASGASVPTQNDDVYFDANSFTIDGQIVVLDISATYPLYSTAKCRNMNWTGVLHSPTLKFGSGSYYNYELDIYGSFVLESSVSLIKHANSLAAVITFKATSGTWNIDTKGIQLTDFWLRIGGTGMNATYNLQSTLKIQNHYYYWCLYIQTGTFNTNNNAIDLENMILGDPNYPILRIGSGVTFNAGSSTFDIHIAVNNNMMNGIGIEGSGFNAGTSVINLTNCGLQSLSNLNEVNIDCVNHSKLTNLIFGGCTIENLNLSITTCTPYFLFSAGSTSTVTNLNANGSAGNLITFSPNPDYSWGTIIAFEIVNGGSGYLPNEVCGVIAGDGESGESGYIKILTVDENGAILTAEIDSSDENYNFFKGNHALRNPGEVLSVVLANGGSNYEVNDILLILPSIIIGDSEAIDGYIEVLGVDGSGTITSYRLVPNSEFDIDPSSGYLSGLHDTENQSASSGSGATFVINAGGVGGIINITEITDTESIISADEVSMSYLKAVMIHALGDAAPFNDTVGGVDGGGNTGITFVNPPIADFSATPLSGNSPLSVEFTDLSTNTPTSWLWDFYGDGSVTSAEQNPTFEYPAAGIYTVKLTATNAGGSDTETKTAYITVSDPVPVANFSATPLSGTEPLSVAFTDLSTNDPTSWLWDFKNDGSALSTEQNPTYIYEDYGTYTVKLTVTNAAGSDSEIKVNYITITITSYQEQYNAGIEGKLAIAPPRGTVNNPTFDGSGVSAKRTYTLRNKDGIVALQVVELTSGRILFVDSNGFVVDSTDLLFDRLHVVMPGAIVSDLIPDKIISAGTAGVLESILGLVTSLGTPGSDNDIPTEKAVRSAISAAAGIFLDRAVCHNDELMINDNEIIYI